MFDLGRTLLAAAARSPRAVALIDGGQRLTYGELAGRAGRLAGGLRSIGLGKGDRLLVLLTNRLEMALTHWACQLAGIVVTPLNWRIKAGELGFFTTDSGARAVLFEELTAAAVDGCAEAGALARIGVGCPAPFDFEDLCTGEIPEDLPAAGAPDPSLMLYTSGTTGKGKGVPRTHAAERAAAIAHIAQNCYARGAVTLGIMPLYHTMGVRSLLAMALVDGTFVCQHRFDPGEALALIERHRIDNLYLVPTLYHDLLAHAGFAATDTSSVRRLGFAGAAMTDGLLKRLQAAFAPDLFVNHYGSSEIYTFTVDQDAPAKPGSAGRAGINTEIRVVAVGSADPDDRVPPGTEGQIIATLDGDEAFAGYWSRPDADAKALVGGWYFTGDIGYFDDDGDLFVTGRVDEMVVTGGENVLPAEPESVLSLHPAVAEVAVAGLPHARWGQQLTAFVRRAAPVTWEDLDRWCRESDLAGFKRPRAYVFVDTIPKSPVGKILRRVLVAGDYTPETSPPEET